MYQFSEDDDNFKNYSFDTDLTTRHTFWTVIFGNYFNWLAACSVNQAMVQRCLAMPTLKKAKM